MFRTIRWRLVASFVAVTLLTVGLIGVLALALFRQQTTTQELQFMRANADAVARQAQPLMAASGSRPALQRLAQTAAFLSSAQVRILDRDEGVLADSGLDSPDQEYLWLPSLDDQSLAAELFQERQPLDLLFQAVPPLLGSHGVTLVPLSELPPGTEYTVIRQVDTPWGQQMVFETRRTPEESLPAAQAEPAPDHQSPPASVVRRPIGDASDPAGYVELASNLSLSAQSMAVARRALLLAGLGATVLALLAGLLVSQSLSAPITELSGAVGEMSAGNLDARAPVRRRDEIGQLAHGFNEMAGRLQASFNALAAERDALRRFIADASHELRTPITALKSFNELLRGPAEADAAARQEFVEESAVQIQRLEWITANLLNLSRLEAGLVELDLRPCELGEIIEAATAPFRSAAQEKGITLGVQVADPPLVTRCDRARLEMALTNLLDNAVKFTPAGGEVTVGAERQGASVHLWVADNGPGIDPADLPHIFQRFYRARNADAPGSGLGLAIVQGIVVAHGGAVSVASQPGAGSRFVIELPVESRRSDSG